MLFTHCEMQIYLFYWLFNVTIISSKTLNLELRSWREKKKKVFYHFYYPDLHIHINIWRLWEEKLEAEQLEKKKIKHNVTDISTNISPVWPAIKIWPIHLH